MSALPTSATDETSTKTHDLMVLGKTALATGVGAGLISYLVTPLFPEGEFLKPALHVAVASGVVLYLQPSGSALYRSAAIGALLAAQCKFLAYEAPTAGCIRYGLMAGITAYLSTEYIMPKLLSLGDEVRSYY